MEKRIVTIRKCIGFLLLFCLLIPSVSTLAFAEAVEQDMYPDELWEPHVETDVSLSTGQVTEWSCITFGSYPQTEILAAPSSAVDDYAVQEGDFVEDPDLYEKLTQAVLPTGRGITVGKKEMSGIISASIPSAGA